MIFQHKKPSSLTWFMILAALAMMLGVARDLSAAIVTGATGSHDPSRMIYCNGKYYICSTGGGMKSSTDRLVWSNATSPFPSGVPTSLKNVISSNQGIWAPDIVFYNNKYYLYYAVAASDGLTSAVGLLTNPTLDSSVAGYKWTDVGVVVFETDHTVKRSAIDPCPFVDANGDLWMSYGSGYANGATWSDPTIFIMKLDDTTGLASTADTNLYPVALGHIEGSYVHYHAGYYYAFWNSGGCCSGSSSSYTIHVARSPTVTGTYVDKSGLGNSSVTFLSSTVVKNSLNGNEHGPGHMGILSEGGVDHCTYHYYPDSGGSVIGEETVIWGSDGWPTCGSDFVPGTYKITSVSTGKTLGVQGASSTTGAALEQQTYVTSTFQRWTAAFTYSSGTNADGYYSLTSVGSGQVMDLYQSSTADGGLVEQWTLGTGNNQRWFIEQTSDGKYRIISRAAGKPVSVPTTDQNPPITSSLTNNGADAKVSFPSQSGWSYGLWTTSNLTQPWTLVTTLAGTGSVINYTQTGGGGTQHFWKLQMLETINTWTWRNLLTQEWTFAAP